MTKMLGCATVALVLATAFVAFLPTDPAVTRQTPTLWATPDAISVEVERSRHLDEALAINLRIREERFRIVNEFDAGAININDAIDQFLPLNDEDSATWQFLTAQYRTHTAEELAGYQIMIASYARPEPAKGANAPALGG